MGIVPKVYLSKTTTVAKASTITISKFSQPEAAKTGQENNKERPASIN